MAEQNRRIIIPKGVLRDGDNVVEIPESYEDSKILIAKSRLNGAGGGVQGGDCTCPPRGQFPERGSPPRRPNMPPPRPMPRRPLMPSPSPPFDVSRSMRSSPDTTPRQPIPPQRAPPGRPGMPSPSPPNRRFDSDIYTDASRSMRSSPRTIMPPPRPSPNRPTSPSPPQRRIEETSTRSPDQTIDSLKGFPSVARRPAREQDTPIPEELDTRALNASLEALENIELEELRTVQSKMRNFQEARRDLLVSILSLHEAEIISN